MDNVHICRTCVLPENPIFPLDAEGRCILCSSPALFKHILKRPDTERLNAIIEEIKKKREHKRYDCLVAWSGGRDSTYMIHELVNTHHLNCIAVFGKTPFTPPETIESVHEITRLLKIKTIEVNTPANHQQIAAYCLKQYIKHSHPILINLACASCKMINKEIFKYARHLGIKTIIYGGNRFEYFPLGPASINIHSEDRYSSFNMLRDNIQRIIKGAGLLISSPALLKYIITFFEASVLYVNQYTIFLKLKYPDINRFDYYHYADWEEDKISAVLRSLNWKLPSGCTSSWRADCVFEAVKNTAFKKRLGFTYSQAMYSNLIRAGKITRDEALKRLDKEGISEPRLHKALDLCRLPVNIFSEGND